MTKNPTCGSCLLFIGSPGQGQYLLFATFCYFVIVLNILFVSVYLYFVHNFDSNSACLFLVCSFDFFHLYHMRVF